MRLNPGVFAYPPEKVYSTDSNLLIALRCSFAPQRFCVSGETVECQYCLKPSLLNEFSDCPFGTGEGLIAPGCSVAVTTPIDNV